MTVFQHMAVKGVWAWAALPSSETGTPWAQGGWVWGLLLGSMGGGLGADEETKVSRD